MLGLGLKVRVWIDEKRVGIGEEEGIGEDGFDGRGVRIQRKQSNHHLVSSS